MKSFKQHISESEHAEFEKDHKSTYQRVHRAEDYFPIKTGVSGHKMYAHENDPHFVGKHPGGHSNTVLLDQSKMPSYDEIRSTVSENNPHLDSAHHDVIAKAIHKDVQSHPEFFGDHD